ncbi:MAG: non-homologous end-joining DNA ligase [Bacillota bacterium]
MTISESILTQIGERKVQLTNLDKIYWPKDGYAKSDLVRYYSEMAHYILPHLKDRPLSLVRYPSGIHEAGFYQKDAPQGMPDWVRIAPVYSKEKESYTNFILCDNLETLVWMANSGVIEINPWLSTYERPDQPDFAVFDIDPSQGATWDDVRIVAKMVRSLLDELGLQGFPKVSGATGVHIYVPIEAKYSYKQVSEFVGWGASLIRDAYPQKVTLERKIKDRTGKVYIDYPQNARGQTITSVYGVRASDGAPVSMPINWEELDDPQVNPQAWNIKNALARVSQKGDIFAPVLALRQSLDRLWRGASPRY